MNILREIASTNGAPLGDALMLASPKANTDAPAPGAGLLFEPTLKKRTIYMLFIWCVSIFRNARF